MTIATDDNWVARLQGDEPGRSEALGELRELILRGLSHSLNRRYGSSFQADDVVQEALLKILSSLDSFEGRSRFLTWAMSVATRVGISALRRKHTRDISLESLSEADLLKYEPHEPSVNERNAQRRQMVDVLNQLVDSLLTAKQRLVVRGLLEGVPVDELARRLGSNRNATYKLLHDARQKLKAGLEQSGLTAQHIISLWQ